VRRAGVTEALQTLSSESSSPAADARSRFSTAKGLEKIAGHFHGAREAEYQRLMC
jgi:hypothetical protein